ncbi:hypothetical protein G5211_00240 [Escherichia phage vB_EcoM_G5211]|nr:hypothetical protein G5211_00240 [Escherichia phage vB_EcoM_G5211]
MKELELKYYAHSQIGVETICDLWVAMYDGYNLVDRDNILKHEFYYDTEDHALRRKGIYARLDVNRSLIMVKIGDGESGLFNREEITFSTMDDFYHYVDSLGVNSDLIVPLLQVMTYRKSLTLDLEGAIVEMCKDTFYYCKVGKVMGDAHYELEFELKSGDEKALDIIREMMLEYVGDDLSPSEISKAERGFQLMTKEG